MSRHCFRLEQFQSLCADRFLTQIVGFYIERPHMYVRYALASLLLACSLGTCAASAAAPELSIADVQVGIAGHYKLGRWTPVLQCIWADRNDTGKKLLSDTRHAKAWDSTCRNASAANAVLDAE